MDLIVRDWAGKERQFRLTVDEVFDLEAARDCGIGEIFLRMTSGRFYQADVMEVLRLGLRGGGLGAQQARQLTKERFSYQPILASVEVALDVMIAAMNGIEVADSAPEAPTGNPADRYKISDMAALCQVFGLSTEDIRAMRYADLVNLIKGFNAASDGKAPHLTEEEFDDILARYEPVE